MFTPALHPAHHRQARFTATRPPRTTYPPSPRSTRNSSPPSSNTRRTSSPASPTPATTPAEVIASLESLVATTRSLTAALTAAGPKARTPEFRRAEEDILILNGLGTYFANLFRAALFYSALLSQSYDPIAAKRVNLPPIQWPRKAWAGFSERAKSVYSSDISYGSNPTGAVVTGPIASQPSIPTWINGLPQELWVRRIASRRNAAEVRWTCCTTRPTPTPRLTFPAHHTPPATFHPGEDLWLTIATPRPHRRSHPLVSPRQPRRALALCSHGRASRNLIPPPSPPPTPHLPTRCSTTSSCAPPPQQPFTRPSTPPGATSPTSPFTAAPPKLTVVLGHRRRTPAFCLIP